MKTTIAYTERNKVKEVIKIMKHKAKYTAVVTPETKSYFNRDHEEIAREIYVKGGLEGITVFTIPNIHPLLEVKDVKYLRKERKVLLNSISRSRKKLN